MDISTMTVIELKKIAKKKGISGVSKLKKADLIKTIKKKVEFRIKKVDSKDLKNKIIKQLLQKSIAQNI